MFEAAGIPHQLRHDVLVTAFRREVENAAGIRLDDPERAALLLHSHERREIALSRRGEQIGTPIVIDLALVKKLDGEAAYIIYVIV